MEKVYIVSIQEHHSWRIVFVSGDIEKVKNFLRSAYKLNDEDIKYLIEWKEIYQVFTDSKLTLEEIELDKDYSFSNFWLIEKFFVLLYRTIKK